MITPDDVSEAGMKAVEASLELKTLAVRDDGCFGVLLWRGRPFAVSVERTFENLRTVLANGTYLCHRDFYHKGGYETFEIEVKGHDRVLFHRGNLETESEACVIVAESFGVLKGKTAVLDAKTGFTELMQLTIGLKEFYMRVSGR